MRIDLNLNRLLSFTSLMLGWVVANVIKLRLYGLAGFDAHWNIKNPDFWVRLSVHSGLIFGGGVIFLLLAAIVVDWFLWPYFFRDEVHEVKQIT